MSRVQGIRMEENSTYKRSSTAIKGGLNLSKITGSFGQESSSRLSGSSSSSEKVHGKSHNSLEENVRLMKKRLLEAINKIEQDCMDSEDISQPSERLPKTPPKKPINFGAKLMLSVTQKWLDKEINKEDLSQNN